MKQKSLTVKWLLETFYADRDLAEDPECKVFPLYRDADLREAIVSPHGEALQVKKMDKDEYLRVLEWGGGGAGYAVWGGGTGRNFGNPSVGRSFYGRGFGFGSSNTGSGTYSMYTYDVKPLNTTLEPDNHSVEVPSEIHQGTVVKGKVIGMEKHVIGQVQKIEMDAQGDVLYYLTRDPDTAKTYKLDPTATFIWEPQDENPHPGSADIPSMSGVQRTGRTHESFYPRLK